MTENRMTDAEYAAAFAESYVRRVWELIARDHDGAPLDLDPHGLWFREAMAFHAMTGVAARIDPFSPARDSEGQVLA